MRPAYCQPQRPKRHPGAVGFRAERRSPYVRKRTTAWPSSALRSTNQTADSAQHFPRVWAVTFRAMTAQRRTALLSIVAAAALIALKLGTGLATHSLGLLSEAAHSGTDLVAALLTFFAVGVAERPADVGHQYGHGKAEHLAALGEATILVVASLVIVWRAIVRLTGNADPNVHAAWYALVVIGGVIAVDVARTIASARAARRYVSAALASNALHFGSDLAGSGAVLVGLVLGRHGSRNPDSIAALFVAVLVLIAAARLMRRNVDVLMDRAPADAEEAALRAINRIK